MSLFGSLFCSSGDGSSNLFGESSKFKAHHDSKRPVDKIGELPEQLHVLANPKESKRALGTGTADGHVQANAADAAALKLQAGIAEAKAVQHASDVHQLQAGDGKRRKRDKISNKVHKTEAYGSPTAAKQQRSSQEQPSQIERQQEQPQHIVKGTTDNGKKYKSNSITARQPQAVTAAVDLAQRVPTTVRDALQSDAQQTDAIAVLKSKPTPAEEAEKLSRTIFVGNLPVAVKRKQLTRLFSQYGEVDSVRLRSVPLDLESKQKLSRKAAVIKGVVSSDRGGTNAYVVFQDPMAVAAALAANMTEVEGHHIRVDTAAPPSAAAAADGAAHTASSNSSALYDPVRSVFVGNLDFKVTEEELIRTFSDGVAQPELSAAVEAVRVVRDPKTNIGKGIAYVLFKTKAAARAALQLDGQQLGKRGMRVSRVDKKATATAAAAGKQKQNNGPAAGGAKRVQDKAGQGRGLAVRQGGVQKRVGAGKPGSAAAADWQGLRTKGKGAGFRSGSRALTPSGGRGGSKSGGSSRGQGKGGKAGGPSKPAGKRPAVAARKEKAKAAAKRAKASK